MNLNKKAQFEDWIVHVIFYAALIVVLAVIIWGVFTGKLTSVWENIMNKVRFS